MMKNQLITRIQADMITRYLDDDIGPLFIACIRKDQDFQENLNQLEGIALGFRKDGVMVGYILDDLLTYFTNRFGIGGTPTYLMIRSGVVLGTLLGRNSSPALVRFIKETGRRCKPKTRTGRAREKQKAAGKISSGKNERVG